MSKWEELWAKYDRPPLGQTRTAILKRIRAEGDRLDAKAYKAEEYYASMREFQKRNSDQARQIRALKSRTGICLVCGGVCV